MSLYGSKSTECNYSKNKVNATSLYALFSKYLLKKMLTLQKHRSSWKSSKQMVTTFLMTNDNFFFLMYNHTTIQNWIFSQKLFGEKNPTYAMYSISPVVVTLHSSVYCLVSSALHLKTDQMVWNWQFKAVRLIKKIVTIFQTPRNFRVNE